MRGNFPVKLNIDSRPIANKYCEGKVKRTLERELKVPEIDKREANETSSSDLRLVGRERIVVDEHRKGLSAIVSN